MTQIDAAPTTNPENKAVRPAVPGTNPPERRGRFGMPSGFASIRDVLSFIAGLTIISHEVWWSNHIEIALLTVGVALAGLPVVFGADEKRKPPPP